MFSQPLGTICPRSAPSCPRICIFLDRNQHSSLTLFHGSEPPFIDYFVLLKYIAVNVLIICAEHAPISLAKKILEGKIEFHPISY